jgi:AraC-like DNA-binding protein
MPRPILKPSVQGAPLHGFPLLETQDSDEFYRGITGLFGDFSIDIAADRKSPHAFSARVNLLRLGQIGMMYGRYGSKIRARFSDVQFYTQGITLRGSGEQATVNRRHIVRGNTGGVLSPGTLTGLTLAAGFEHLALLIHPDAVVSKLAAITGRPVAAPPRMSGETDLRKPVASRLRDLAIGLTRRTFHGAPVPLFVADMEQRAILLFLLANDHAYRDELDSDPPHVATWQVQRTEEFIEANWHRHISIEMLSAISGCSFRRLFYQSQRGRGYPPLQFVRHVRLQRAKEMLTRPNDATSVTEVAFACGFGNLEHFSKYYRQEFGELPSKNLERGRRRNG